jgi:phosphoenolpyruvate-protein kinase (PTS system EI component)
MGSRDLTVNLGHKPLLFESQLAALLIALAKSVKLLFPMAETAEGPLN